MSVPPGASPGTKIKLERKGVKQLNGGKKGDHYINVKVAIPSKLSRAQRTIFEELAKLEGVEVSSNPGFFDRFKF